MEDSTRQGCIEKLEKVLSNRPDLFLRSGHPISLAFHLRLLASAIREISLSALPNTIWYILMLDSIHWHSCVFSLYLHVQSLCKHAWFIGYIAISVSLYRNLNCSNVKDNWCISMHFQNNCDRMTESWGKHKEILLETGDSLRNRKNN